MRQKSILITFVNLNLICKRFKRLVNLKEQIENNKDNKLEINFWISDNTKEIKKKWVIKTLDRK